MRTPEPSQNKGDMPQEDRSDRSEDMNKPDISTEEKERESETAKKGAEVKQNR